MDSPADAVTSTKPVAGCSPVERRPSLAEPTLSPNGSAQERNGYATVTTNKKLKEKRKHWANGAPPERPLSPILAINLFFI
jgi:hypothetical protein